MKKCSYCEDQFDPTESDFENFCNGECADMFNDQMYPTLED